MAKENPNEFTTIPVPTEHTIEFTTPEGEQKNLYELLAVMASDIRKIKEEVVPK